MSSFFYISLPSILCSAGNEIDMYRKIVSMQRCFKQQEIEGKTFLIGGVELKVSKNDFPQAFRNNYTRTNALLFQTALGFTPEIERLKTKFGKDRIGVCVGSTTAGIEENFQLFLKEKDFALKYQENFNSLGHPAKFLKDFFGLQGPSFGLSTACTSGLKALIQASRMIQSNLCDAVIAGGVDAISAISLFGFDSLGILSSKPCNPFSVHRDGINIGEGSCLFIVSRNSIDTSVVLKSFYSNNDAFHLTKQEPQAQKAKEAIMNALQNYNIDYINLHATGTIANEAAESKAISTTLPMVPASGIKGCIGHTLGAAGAIEIGLCAMLLNQKDTLLPPHIYDQAYDPSLPKISLIHKPLPASISHILSVNFAFGGDNAAAVLGRAK